MVNFDCSNILSPLKCNFTVGFVIPIPTLTPPFSPIKTLPVLVGWICNGEQEFKFWTYKSVIQSPEVFPVNVVVKPVIVKEPFCLSNVKVPLE